VHVEIHSSITISCASLSSAVCVISEQLCAL